MEIASRTTNGGESGLADRMTVLAGASMRLKDGRRMSGLYGKIPSTSSARGAADELARCDGSGREDMRVSRQELFHQVREAIAAHRAAVPRGQDVQGRRGINPTREG